MAKHWEPGYKGPLPGNQLEFLSPFARKGQENESTPESRVICFCNEFVGLGLGFPLAPARMGVFGEGAGNSSAQTNAGKTFSKRASKGANQFKLLLRPGTEITATYFDPENYSAKTTDYPKKTVNISFDSTVSVTEVKLWLAGAAFSKQGLMLNVYGIVTPALKTHPIGSRSNPDINIPVTSAMTQKANELGIKLIQI